MAKTGHYILKMGYNVGGGRLINLSLHNFVKLKISTIEFRYCGASQSST